LQRQRIATASTQIAWQGPSPTPTARDDASRDWLIQDWSPYRCHQKLALSSSLALIGSVPSIPIID
jgi:hypothetical protein